VQTMRGIPNFLATFMTSSAIPSFSSIGGKGSVRADSLNGGKGTPELRQLSNAARSSLA